MRKIGLAKVGQLELAKVGLAKVGFGQSWKIRMAKVGLAKVGLSRSIAMLASFRASPFLYPQLLSHLELSPLEASDYNVIEVNPLPTLWSS